MRRIAATLTAFALVIAAAGCSGGGASQPQSASADVSAAQASASAPSAPAGSEKVWHYEVKTENYSNEYKNGNGELMASVNYEYPVLAAVDEDGRIYDGEGEAPSKEMLDACEAFNSVLVESDFEDAFNGLCKMADENLKLSEEYGGFFSPCFEELSIDSVYMTGSMASVDGSVYSYWGGAHPDGGKITFNFDLEEGDFFELDDLTDEPENMRRLISDRILDEIYEDSYDVGLFEGFEEEVYALNEIEYSFNENGLGVTFPEYTIGPHAAGLPYFEIPYDLFAGCLNERGLRLLELPQETLILADFHEAQQIWDYFNMTTMPLDYYDAVEQGDYTYCRVDWRGISTMTELRALLETRFSDDITDKLLDPDDIHYREIDGVLRATDAARGADISRGGAEYSVELNGNKGKVTAVVEEYDLDAEPEYDEQRGDYFWPLAGHVTIEFPFTLSDSGARFEHFESIW